MYEETLINVRKEKHQALNGTTYPLASDNIRSIGSALEFFEFDTVLHCQRFSTIKTSIVPSELDQDLHVNIAGRVSAFRKSGSIAFIKITDNTGSIQLIASKAAYADFDKLKLIDLGDIIECEGLICLSKTGEKSILIRNVTLLSKSINPPPEKHEGIHNTETKYRQRYVDLMSSEETRARFIIRSYIIKYLRSFMEDRNFLEVETSTLSTIASGANAKPFTTHHNALDMELNLRIAPELNLKRLLVGGMDKVFEIGRNYRNEGLSSRHNPEFTMLECYEAYASFPKLMFYAKEILSGVDYYVKKHMPANYSNYFLNYLDARTFTLHSFIELSMQEATIVACKNAGINVGVTNVLTIVDKDNPRLSFIDTAGLTASLSNCKSDGEVTMTLFESVAEPFLTEDYRTGDGKYSLPVFITEFPKDVCPLARSNDSNPDICDRFELYLDGKELMNGFQELNDPEEQALRFQNQLDSNQKDSMAYDADYVDALRYGMPPAIGFGLGVDRFCMMLTNSSSIKDVILFPVLKTENNK